MMTSRWRANALPFAVAARWALGAVMFSAVFAMAFAGGVARAGSVVCASNGSTGQDVPASDGWVTDLAGFLNSKQERELEKLMESYRRGSEAHEIALLTVPDLGGEPIERFALRVARDWGLGLEGKNNGALIVVSKGDRKMRIEVGNGLEGTLTDLVSGRIIRNVMAPLFKRGRFAQGLREGIRATHAAAGGDYGALERRRGRGSTGGIGGMLFIFFTVMLISIIGRSRRGVGSRVRTGGLPWIFLAASSGSRGGFGGGGGGLGGGGFGGFGGGGGFSGGGASGGW